MIDQAAYKESIANMDVQIFAMESFIKRYERSVYYNMADRGYSFLTDISELHKKLNRLSAIRMEMYVQLMSDNMQDIPAEFRLTNKQYWDLI